jgi:membrane protein required for colicin V production
MTVFDYAVFAIVGLSVVLGIVRGAVREVLALGAWIAAFLVAKSYSVEASAWLAKLIGNASLQLIVAFIALFVVTLIVVSLASLLLSAAIKKIGLGPLDRLLGLLVGAVRGLLIVLVLVLLGGMTGLPRQSDWQHALTSPWLEGLAGNIKPWLPEGLAKRINFGPRRV